MHTEERAKQGHAEKENNCGRFEILDPATHSVNDGIKKHNKDRQKLAAGPILRAAWIHNGKIRVRYWLELWDMSTSEVREVNFIDPGNDKNIKYDEIKGTELIALPNSKETLNKRFRWCDFAFVNKKYVNPIICLKSGAENGPVSCEQVSHNDTTPPWLGHLKSKNGEELLDDFNFLVGSCRYPGTPFEANQSDKVFEGMLKVIEGKDNNIDVLFLIGDQIYADATADLFDSRVPDDKFMLPYRHAFMSTNARKVLSRLPVHFAVDDHEIRDNWSGEDYNDKNLAVIQARSYMVSAREKSNLGNARKPDEGSLWYALDHKNEAVFPSFVMDSRTERQQSADFETSRLIGVNQLEAFKKWLKEVEGFDQPKFVFAGQIITPLSRRFHSGDGLWRNEDGFVSCPDTLGEIIECILTSKVENLVFVGGDQHLSCTTKMVLSDRKGDKPRTRTVWQIVASGLYAPMPFANAKERDFDWNKQCTIVHLAKHTITYEARFLTASQSHFVRVKATKDKKKNRWCVSVAAFNENGVQIETDPTDTVGNSSLPCLLELELETV